MTIKTPPGGALPSDSSGKWIAWNREQTRTIAIGRTFAEVKQAAAAAGEHSVLMAKIPPPEARSLFPGYHVLHVIAVFISQMS